jgi:hypothetical protein
MFLRNISIYLPKYMSSEIYLQGYNVLLVTCLTLVSDLAYYSTLKMEAACSSERLDIVHCKRQTILLSERAPHINKPETVRKNLILHPKCVLDTKTDWPTDRRS